MSTNSLRSWAQLATRRHGYQWHIHTPAGVFVLWPDPTHADPGHTGPCRIEPGLRTPLDRTDHRSLGDARAAIAEHLGLTATTEKTLRAALR
ncbi:hypothetical protein [Mycolicibacterium sp. CBMA 361]|uniref:hypothetical protein n=1 Tax=Mycolicibacterium sp. CBMA 361 TaxID=2606610 RepID=UPI0012DC2B71|nr:hypothetical protein [Mycolicibacterium sp. CBMA 361]MUM34849.1 hypothetical protein [Mycolicibacterium sp. CBMA 361]